MLGKIFKIFLFEPKLARVTFSRLSFAKLKSLAVSPILENSPPILTGPPFKFT